MSDPVIFQCPRSSLEMVTGIHLEYALHTLGPAVGLPDLHEPKILDVGAHVGTFAYAALRRWPDAEVTCYEPHPETYALLVNNTRGLVVRTRNVAVVHPRREEKVRLYEPVAGEGRHGCSTKDNLRWPHISQDYTKWVEVDTIDSSELSPCDVMKIDHEGGEPETMEGYPHGRGVKVLLVEAHAVDGSVEKQAWQVATIAQGWGLRLIDRRGCVLRFVR